MAFDIGSVVAHIKADISDFQEGMKTVEKSADSFKTKLGDVSDKAKQFGKTWSLYVTAPIVAGGALALKTAADYEQLQVSFSTILGSQEKAVKLLSQIQEFSKSTPFQFSDVATGAKQLLAYGFAQEDIIKNTRMLGDVSAGLSIPIGDLIYLYGTLRAQEVAYTKDINQFTNRGIPMWQELANVMHKSVPEVRALVEAGEVGFPIVEQAFRNMTGEGGKFNDMMTAQSKTTAGQFSNLQDSVAFLARDLGTLLLPTAILLVQKLTELVNWVNGLSEGQKQLIIIIAVVVAAIGPLMLVLSGLITVVNAAIAVGTAFGAVLAFIAANPIVWIIAAIVALIAAGVWLYTHWDVVKQKAQALWDFIRNGWNILVDNLRYIGNAVLDAIMWPFNEAKKRIEEAVNWIKDRLDFTKRHSPSVLDIVKSGVSKVNDALSDLPFSANLTANAAGVAVSHGGNQTNTNIIQISLDGAMIADKYGANQMAEFMGDAIIKKLQGTIRI